MEPKVQSSAAMASKIAMEAAKRRASGLVATPRALKKIRQPRRWAPEADPIDQGDNLGESPDF